MKLEVANHPILFSEKESSKRTVTKWFFKEEVPTEVKIRVYNTQLSVSLSVFTSNGAWMHRRGQKEADIVAACRAAALLEACTEIDLDRFREIVHLPSQPGQESTLKHWLLEHIGAPREAT